MSKRSFRALSNLEIERTTAFLGISLLIVPLLLSLQLYGPLLMNQGSIYTVRAALESRSYAIQAQETLTRAAAAGQPRANWSLGLLAKWQDDNQARQAAQLALIQGAPRRMDLLSRLEPDDEMLASFALAHYSDISHVLAWRASQLRETKPEQSVRLYEQALALSHPAPYDWWMGLGNAYEHLEDFESAMIAYETACESKLGPYCSAIRRARKKMQGTLPPDKW